MLDEIQDTDVYSFYTLVTINSLPVKEKKALIECQLYRGGVCVGGWCVCVVGVLIICYILFDSLKSLILNSLLQLRKLGFREVRTYNKFEV